MFLFWRAGFSLFVFIVLVLGVFVKGSDLDFELIS